MLINPDVRLDAKAQSETFEDDKTCLDVELNLSSSSSSNVKTIMKKEISGDIGLSRSPSWLAFEGDDDDNNKDQRKQEMVKTVCMKCHMLVMLCKFMHLDDHCSTKQFKLLY